MSCNEKGDNYSTSNDYYNDMKNLIEATILTGCARGESVFVPRIPLIYSDLPFDFKRLQFPLRVCFAMTINKSQGQTLKYAGVDLREHCFSHGQCYVACSRVSSPSGLVLLTSNERYI
jgi:ATP-dependent DNA helicase PIF1